MVGGSFGCQGPAWSQVNRGPSTLECRNERNPPYHSPPQDHASRPRCLGGLLWLVPLPPRGRRSFLVREHTHMCVYTRSERSGTRNIFKHSISVAKPLSSWKTVRTSSFMYLEGIFWAFALPLHARPRPGADVTASKLSTSRPV